MALFAPAIQNTEMWEGGYSYSPSDSGGETYRGISRANWPTWSGWFLIDAAKVLPGFPISLDANVSLQGSVVQFYHSNFWQYDGVNSQIVANKVFDLSVNVGVVHAIKILQQALNSILPSASNLTVDGHYGPQTEQNINSTSEGPLVIAIRAAAVQYHQSIVATHPQDAIYLAGWLRRDNS